MELILKTRNGSKLYGLDHDQSDDDYLGIFVESPGTIFMGDKLETVPLGSTSNDRKVAGEIDGTAYSVRHFFRLAANKGNPSILAILFVPNSAIVESTLLGRQILAHRDLFVSKQAIGPFRGYLKAQLDRLKGDRKGHTPNRPELIEQFGYDCKFAMHVARLAYQGTEFLSTGKITLPMPADEQKVCRDVRHGSFSYEECLEILETLAAELDKSARTSGLPSQPDNIGIAELSQAIHEFRWKNNQGDYT